MKMESDWNKGGKGEKESREGGGRGGEGVMLWTDANIDLVTLPHAARCRPDVGNTSPPTPARPQVETRAPTPTFPPITHTAP